MKKEIIGALNWRYATQQFDTTLKIPEDELKILLETMRLAPSSFGLQPWKFIVITDQKLKDKLRPHAWDQPKVSECSHLIVLCARTDVNETYIKRFTDHTAQTQGVGRESLKGFEDMLLNFRRGMDDAKTVEWAKKQVYLALGVLLEAAALLKIDAGPMEGFFPDKFDEELKLKEKNLTAAVICALGYRLDSDKASKRKKVRFQEKDVIIRI